MVESKFTRGYRAVWRLEDLRVKKSSVPILVRAVRLRLHLSTIFRKIPSHCGQNLCKFCGMSQRACAGRLWVEPLYNFLQNTCILWSKSWQPFAISLRLPWPLVKPFFIESCLTLISKQSRLSNQCSSLFFA